MKGFPGESCCHDLFIRVYVFIDIQKVIFHLYWRTIMAAASPKAPASRTRKTSKASSDMSPVPFSPAAATKNARRQKVVAALNKARSMELFAITQYMNQHYALDDMDYGELAANMKLIAIDEMRHAEMFAERIKELGGDPVTERSGTVVKGQTVRQVYPYDAAVEDDTIDTYNQFLLICRECGDGISAKLLEDIAAEEQVHQSYFSNVADHIASLGDSYLSKIAGTNSSTGGTTKGFAIAPASGA